MTTGSKNPLQDHHSWSGTVGSTADGPVGRQTGITAPDLPVGQTRPPFDGSGNCPKTLRSLSQLLTYPDEQTLEAAELLYIILQGELPDAAQHMSNFGAFVEGHELWEVEEAFTGTFDVNPACALEVGWHLFGEEYARGMFLVRMREELRKYDLQESIELPDHITHVLAVIGAMPEDEGARFVTACVLPAVAKMRAALEKKNSPYRDVVACLADILQHVWGDGETLIDGSKTHHSDSDAIPGGVDLLHAFPVADALSGCGDGACGSHVAPGDLVQLSFDRGSVRSADS